MDLYVKNRGIIYFLIILLVIANSVFAQARSASALVAKPGKMFCGTPVMKYKGMKELTNYQLYDLLRLTGFEGQALKQAWAIAMKETHGNPLAHNFNPRTQDDSYGVFQINLYGSLKSRIDQFGLESAKDLKDPVTNARIAFLMSGKGKNWSAWKGNPGQRDHWLVQKYLKKLTGSF